MENTNNNASFFNTVINQQMQNRPATECVGDNDSNIQINHLNVTIGGNHILKDNVCLL